MSRLGIGVMFNRLLGNEDSAAAIKASVGEKIVEIKLYDNVLSLKLANGKTLKLWDDGQSCCEQRYMVCDDDFVSYIGSKLLGLRLEAAESLDDVDYGSHEVEFLIADTSSGSFTVSNHNEHNGYYGGFSLTAKLEQ